jgi:hypothetical protein
MAATRKATVLGLGAAAPYQSGEIRKDSKRSEPVPASAQRAVPRRAVRVDQVEPRAVSLATGAMTPSRIPGVDLRSSMVRPRDAFLYDQIDGKLDVDDLADQSGMTRAEVLTTLLALEALGLVRLGR